MVGLEGEVEGGLGVVSFCIVVCGEEKREAERERSVGSKRRNEGERDEKSERDGHDEREVNNKKRGERQSNGRYTRWERERSPSIFKLYSLGSALL